jgi:hypothetical protein
LRTHVVTADAGHHHRLLHRVASERLAQFLIENDFDECGDATGLCLAGGFSAAVNSAGVRTTTPFISAAASNG